MLAGITIKIDPIILQIGSFELGWHSVLTIIAIVAAIVFAVYESKRKAFPTAEIYNLAPWALIGGIIGARLFYVIDQWSFYSANPLRIVELQLGGLAIWGAVIGGAIAVIVFALVKHISLTSLFDLLTPGLLTAQIIGRVGCIINGDAWGAPTSMPWGFIYANPADSIPGDLMGVPTHPYPVYEMIWNGLILVIVLTTRKRVKRDGVLFLMYLMLYSVGRFGLTFFREERVWFWGLQEAQIISIGIFIIALVAMVYLLLRRITIDKTSEEETPAAVEPDSGQTVP